MGAVLPKPGIASFAGDVVRFTDGSEARADLVVHCTGYTVSFPFLNGAVPAIDNRVDLFHQVFPPGVPDLAFVGLVQPFGALMPVAEAQAAWIADWLDGRYHLPPQAAMLEQVARQRRQRERQFIASPRHTLEIDYHAYLRAIHRERRRGSASGPAARPQRRRPLSVPMRSR